MNDVVYVLFMLCIMFLALPVLVGGIASIIYFLGE